MKTKVKNYKKKPRGLKRILRGKIRAGDILKYLDVNMYLDAPKFLFGTYISKGFIVFRFAI